METSITREGIINAMGAPRKYPDELRERATRMALEALADPGLARGAIVADSHLRASGTGPVHCNDSARARRTDGANVQFRAGSGGGSRCCRDLLYVRGAPREIFQLYRIRHYRRSFSSEVQGTFTATGVPRRGSTPSVD